MKLFSRRTLASHVARCLQVLRLGNAAHAPMSTRCCLEMLPMLARLTKAPLPLRRRFVGHIFQGYLLGHPPQAPHRLWHYHRISWGTQHMCTFLKALDEQRSNPGYPRCQTLVWKKSSRRATSAHWDFFGSPSCEVPFQSRSKFGGLITPGGCSTHQELSGDI